VAKKKKLNKRAVAVLVVVGAVVVLAVAVATTKYWLPRDPAPFADKARKAFEANNFEEARRLYGIAINYDRARDANYLYRLAKTEQRLLESAKLTQTEQREKMGAILDLFQKAARLDANYLEAHQALCELYWGFYWQSRDTRQLINFLPEANQVLRLQFNDANMFDRRATAKAVMALSEDPPDPARINDAIADFTKAQEIDPNELAYWMDLVNFLSQVKADPKLIDANVPAVFERAVAREPNSVALRAQYAEYLRTHDQKDEALKQIEEAVRRQPGDVEAYLARSDYFENLNDLIEARKSLDKARQINDSDYRIYGHLASLLFRQRQYDEAFDSMRKGLGTVTERLDKATDKAEIRRLTEAAWQMNYQLARLMLDRYIGQQNQSPATLVELQKCMDAMTKLAPDHRGASSIAGMLAYVQGDMRKSVNLLQQSIKESGSVDPMTAGVIANALMRLQEPTRAQEILEEMGRKTGAGMNPMLTLQTAELKLMARDYTGADVEIAKVLQANPENLQALSLKCVLDIMTGDRPPALPDKVILSPLYVNMLLDRAAQLLSNMRGGEALALTQSVHKKVPGNRQVIALLLDVYLNNNMEERAEDLRKEAQASDPALATWVGDQIDIRSQKDPQKRFELMKSLLDRDATIKGAMKELELVRIAEQCGPALAKEAEDHLQAAAKLDPNSPSVVDMCFNRSLAKADWKPAEMWADKAAAINADGMNGHWFSARLAMARQQWQPAIEHLNEVVRLRPDSKLPRSRLGDCYQSKGELDKAQGYYQSVLKVDGSFYPAVRGMVILTAQQNKPTDHDFWVERASKLPAARDDEYVRQEAMKIVDRRGDPKALFLRIDERYKAFIQNPDNLDNTYQLGALFERAQHSAESARDANQAAMMGRNAEVMFRAVYEKSPEVSKLFGAKPLAEYYGRNRKKSELLSFLDELGKLPNVDKLELQILAGDSLSFTDASTAELAYKQALNVAPADGNAYKALGRFYERQNRWADAIGIYNKYRALTPTDKTPLVLLANAQVQGGDANEAAKALAEVLAADPTNGDALALQGLLAMKQRRYEEAGKAFDAALVGGTVNVRALLGRARLNLVVGQPDKSRQDLQAIRQATNDPIATVEYAQVCEYLGDVQSAELAYLDVLGRQADYRPAVVGLVQLYLTESAWVKLEKQLTEARRTFPDDPAFWLLDSQMWKVRGDQQKSLESLDAASRLAPDSYPVFYEYLMRLLEEKQYDKAIALSNDTVSKPAMHVLALSAKARALVRSGKVPEGEAAFATALKDKTTLTQAVLLSQQVQQAYGSPKAACDAAVRWARDANLTDPYSKVFLGDLYGAAKDYPSAIKYLGDARAAVSSNGEKAAIGFMLGLTYYQNKDFDRSAQTYEEVLKLSPDDLSALNNLAYVCSSDLKDPQRALPYAKRAMELAMGNANVLDTYGWVLVELKKYPEASETLLRAVAIDGTNAILRNHLGYSLEQENRLADSLKNYEEGLKLPAPDDETRTALQQGADRVRKKLKPE
jgi:tetratricopeptide (TPR) repeat protein